jgi:hypothetical protein
MNGENAMKTNHRIGGWIVSGRAKWVTELAVLVKIDGHGDEWIPLSQIRDELVGCVAAFINPPHPEHPDATSMEVELVVNPWWCKQAGVPYEKPSYPARPGSRVARSATVQRPAANDIPF